jgi:hypothetical protein
MPKICEKCIQNCKGEYVDDGWCEGYTPEHR